MKTQLLVAYAALVALLALAPAASASWPFWLVSTASPDYGYEYDGRIYMPDATTLVPEGCLVQFILDTEGDGLDDPLAHFGDDLAAITAWVNAGADPSAFCDDQLLTAANWDGTSVIGADLTYEPITTGPGEILVWPANPYKVINGNTGDIFGWRVWNLSPEDMATFCERPAEELWYTTGVEYGAWYYYTGNATDPWRVGWPDGADPGDWNFFGEIGSEVGMSDVFPGDPLYRTQNVLDHHLATCVPEPGMILLCGIAVLLGRRFQRRAR